jgi:hypothetical protein
VVALAQAKYDDDSVTYKGVAMHIDISRVLQLPLLQSIERLPTCSDRTTAGLWVSMHDDLLLWTNAKYGHDLKQQRGEERSIVFALRPKQVALISAKAPNPSAAPTTGAANHAHMSQPTNGSPP